MFLLFFKRIGILLGILLLLGSFAFSPNQVLAQTAGTPCTTENGASGYWRYVAGTLRCDDSLIGNVVGSQTSKAAKTIDDSSWAVTVLKSGMTFLANIILSLVGSLLTLAGILLNGAVEITVIKMSAFVNHTPAITTAWTVIRDVSNIIILFILLFSAIGTILRTDQLVPKSSLAKIIIAALLINFSMFFTKVIIDVSNVATLAIYNEISSADATRPANLEDAQLYGISGAFMQGLQLQTSYKKILAESKNPNFETHILQQMIFGIIIILIATFVLLMAAIMLIVRFGVLIMLLITSPIGLVGGLIPKMAKYKDLWWSTLLGQAFFAPVFMLFLLISVAIIKSIQTSATIGDANLHLETGVGKLFNFFGGTGDVAVAIQYALTIFFIVFSLTIAKSIAGSAGAGATKWASQKAGSLAFGGAAWAGANTFGRFGKSVADSGALNSLARSSNPAKSFIGQNLIGVGDKFQKASFDVRGVKAVGDLGAGKAAKGYADRRKERADRQAKYAENVKASGEEQREFVKTNNALANQKNADEWRKTDDEKQKVYTEVERLRTIQKGGNMTQEQFAELTKLNRTYDDLSKKADDLKKAIENTDQRTPAEKEAAARKEISRFEDQIGRTGVMRIRQLEEQIKSANKDMKDDERSKLLLTQLNPAEQGYIQARGNLDKAQKELGTLQKQLKETFASQYANSGLIPSNKDAADKIRKGLKEKPIAEELFEKVKKSIEEDTKKTEAPAPAATPEGEGEKKA